MKYTVLIAGHVHVVELQENDAIYVDGVAVDVMVTRMSQHEYSAIVDEHPVRVVVQEGDGTMQLLVNGMACEATIESERDTLLKQYGQSSAQAHHRAEIHAPMPALVVKVEVSIGDEVKEGQGLLVLEAMKMENELKAHQSGTVKKILVTKGKAVEKGELLMVVE